MGVVRVPLDDHASLQVDGDPRLAVQVGSLLAIVETSTIALLMERHLKPCWIHQDLDIPGPVRLLSAVDKSWGPWGRRRCGG